MQHALFQSLNNRVFRQLYGAQTINLLGDAFTWLGLALLAFELGGQQAGGILAIALTIRVTVFVLLSPLAGVLADRVDRKPILIITHLLRMGLVCGLVFVHQQWQLYLIVGLLNCCGAFFTPTYKACIPLVTQPTETASAITLSSTTYQLLGVLGPGLAGGVAVVMGARNIFFWDALTFLLSAILIVTLPRSLAVERESQQSKTMVGIWRDIRSGTWPLLADPVLRYLLGIQWVGAIGGAQILVNTVGYVKGSLQLGQVEYGWVMGALGLGATLGAIGYSYTQQKFNSLQIASAGAVLLMVALLPANIAGLPGLILLWVLAGVGQSAIDVPIQAMIGQRIAPDLQGRVYGAHFAWSHLWWALSYPLAGLLGYAFPQLSFALCSLLGIFGLLLLSWWRPRRWEQDGLWHEHHHNHEQPHSHHLHPDLATHCHLHYHAQRDAHAAR